MIDIIYHDGASAAPDQAAQSGGFAQADGNGEIHCYSWLDGVSAMLMRLEMESYTELRTQKGLLELNFCANGRFETRFSLRDHVLLRDTCDELDDIRFHQQELFDQWEKLVEEQEQYEQEEN